MTYHSPAEYLAEARRATTTAERLDALADVEWEFVRAAVARNPNAAPATIGKLVPDGARPLDEQIALAIARRQDASPEAMACLASRFDKVVDWSTRHPDFALGLALLSNPATPQDVVQKLLDATRTTPHFRSRVAAVTRRPDVLARLFNDVSAAVARRAAKRFDYVCKSTGEEKTTIGFAIHT